MSNLSNLPRGFKFHPSDESLIDSYLLRKTRGHPLPWDGILYVPVYDMAPWDAFRDIINQDSSYRDGRVSRKAGCGTWKGQTGPKKITRLRDGQFIGSSRMFSFMKSKNITIPEEYKTHQWIMHEYSLGGINPENDLVLCKINISYSPTIVPIPGNLGSSTTGSIEDNKIIRTENSEDVYPIPVEEDIQIPTENYKISGSFNTGNFEENKVIEMNLVCRNEISTSSSKEGPAEVQVEGDVQIPRENYISGSFTTGNFEENKMSEMYPIQGNDIPISLSKKRSDLLW